MTTTTCRSPASGPWPTAEATHTTVQRSSRAQHACRSSFARMHISRHTWCQFPVQAGRRRLSGCSAFQEAGGGPRRASRVHGGRSTVLETRLNDVLSAPPTKRTPSQPTAPRRATDNHGGCCQVPPPRCQCSCTSPEKTCPAPLTTTNPPSGNWTGEAAHSSRPLSCSSTNDHIRSNLRGRFLGASYQSAKTGPV